MRYQLGHMAGPCDAAPGRTTALSFTGSLGIHISGAGVTERRVDIFDSWFQPDELDEPAAFRRAGDPESIVRLRFA